MDINKRRNSTKDVFVILFVCLLAICARFLLANFHKVITVYSDELRYYSIARSLFESNGITLRDGFTDYQKITYSLILAPFFSIDDSVLRISAISLVNCIIMVSAVWPLWLIGVELQIKKNYRYAVIFLTLIWPEMVTTATFMSEVLYWPLFFLYVYIWLINQRKPQMTFGVILGMLCYIIYMTKEIFLAMFLAYIGFEMLFPWLDSFLRGEKNGIRNSYDFKRIKICAVSVLVFVICNVLAKLTIFSGLGNSYNQMGIEEILDPYNFCYCIYAFVYYIAVIMVTGLVIPFVLSVVNYKNLGKPSRKVLVLTLFFLVIVAGTIAYTISIREDLGKITPRVHIRYFAPAISVMLMICADAISRTSEEQIQCNRKKIANYFIIFGGFTCCVFKGVGEGSIVDQMSLNWYDAICDQLKILTQPYSGMVEFHIGAILINVTLIVLLVAFYYLHINKRTKYAVSFYLVILASLCLVSNIRTYQTLHECMGVTLAEIEEVDKIDAYFQNTSTDKNILYVTEDFGQSKRSRCIDTYMDCENRLYIVDFSTVNALETDAVNKVDQLYLLEALMHSPYETVDRFDYIIVENSLDFGSREFKNTEEISEISGENYTIYKNNAPEYIQLGIREDIYWDGYKCISFYGEEYNATDYVISGIGDPESDFSWTMGRNMRVEIPSVVEKGTIKVQIAVRYVFNSEQRYIISSGNMPVTNGVMSVPAVIDFELPFSNGMISFDLLMPDAMAINQVYKDSFDTREVAFAISEIIIKKA